jgi:hypothetical protein
MTCRTTRLLTRRRRGGSRAVASIPRPPSRAVATLLKWAWSYEGGLKGTLMDGGARLAVLASSWMTRTCRCTRPSASACSTFEMPRPRRFAASKWSTRHDSAEGSKPAVTSPGSTRNTTIRSRVNNLKVTGDVSGNRLNNAPEWAGRLWGRVEWRHPCVAALVDCGRHHGAVDGLLHAVQRQHPVPEIVLANGARERDSRGSSSGLPTEGPRCDLLGELADLGVPPHSARDPLACHSGTQTRRSP